MIQQRIGQKQHLKILPQQIQLLNLFHFTNLEMDQRIRQELEENPILEENAADEDDLKREAEAVQDFSDLDEYAYDDIPDYKSEYNNYFSGDQIPERPIVQRMDFRQQLKEQCRLLFADELSFQLAGFVIDSFNEYGLLEQDLSSIAEDFSFQYKQWVEEEEVQKVLTVIQGLEPAGIGARNTCECLLLQLKRMPQDYPDLRMATALLRNHFEDLANRQLEKVKHQLKIDEEQLRNILQLISSLQLRPINYKGEDMGVKDYIVPDFIITIEDDQIDIALTRQRSSSLQINHSWMESIKTQCRQKNKETDQYLKRKLQAAEWFISAIRQRENTMLTIMKAIVHWQYDYFREGDRLLLRPMILKNIADAVGMDISTVSRITSNKYAATPFGNILLKDLFSEGMPTESGDSVSSRVIQQALVEVITVEDKRNPYTDHQIVAMLARKGYKIARRTVAKYRELLRIPPAQMRAIWG